jgi:hypothetical protein
MTLHQIDYTGRTNYRQNWLGKLILQVEVRVPSHGPGDFSAIWIDAKVRDLIEVQRLQEKK